MNLSFKTIPFGSLPYDNVETATRMLIKMYDKMPYLPFMPGVVTDENIYERTLSNLPGLRYSENHIALKLEMDDLKPMLEALDNAFNNPTKSNLEVYKFEAAFMEQYLKIIERIKPKETVVNLLGPFTIIQSIVNTELIPIMEKNYRKYVIQAVSVKALWIIHKIKEVSPETTPVIMFEEPLLSKYSEYKRENGEIIKELVLTMYSKVIQKIKETESAVGVQCLEKCDWQIPIEAKVDIISFDAYNNPNNLNIIADKVNNYLADGGRINWGIVPIINDKSVKGLTLDYVYKRFRQTVDELVNSGVEIRHAYEKASVSVNDNVNKLSIIFAEKALILASQLGKKIPTVKVKNPE